MPLADASSTIIPVPSGDQSLVGDISSGYALIVSPIRNIGGLFTDVTIEEVHNDRLEITQHPIQTGAVVTDHSFALPAQLTIRCGSSDSTAGYEGAVQQQYAAFLALQASRVPFQVGTGKRQYSNMLIRELQVTTDERWENALQLTVSLHQVTFADAGDSSPMTADNQLFPQQTSPTVNMGLVALKPWAGPAPFASSVG